MGAESPRNLRSLDERGVEVHDYQLGGKRDNLCREGDLRRMQGEDKYAVCIVTFSSQAQYGDKVGAGAQAVRVIKGEVIALLILGM